MTTHVSHTGPTVAEACRLRVAMTVNLVLLFLVNVAPGWQAVPFLTETTDVLLLVNLSMAAAGRQRGSLGVRPSMGAEHSATR